MYQQRPFVRCTIRRHGLPVVTTAGDKACDWSHIPTGLLSEVDTADLKRLCCDVRSGTLRNCDQAAVRVFPSLRLEEARPIFFLVCFLFARRRPEKSPGMARGRRSARRFPALAEGSCRKSVARSIFGFCWGFEFEVPNLTFLWGSRRVDYRNFKFKAPLDQ